MKTRHAFLLCCWISLIFFSAGCVSAEQEKAESMRSAQIELAKQYISGGQFLSATTLLRNLIQNNPKDFEARFLLGSSLLGQGDTQAAAQSFQRTLSIKPDFDDARLSLAFTEILKKRFASARALLWRIKERGTYGSLEKVETNIGLSYLEEGKCSEGLKYFDKALEIDPTLVSAHFNIGKCRFQEKKFHLAAQSFKRALDFCPSCVDPALELARSLALAGRSREAHGDLRRFLSQNKLDPIQEARAQQLLKNLAAAAQKQRPEERKK